KNVEGFGKALSETADRIQITATQNVGTVTGTAINIAIERIEFGASGDEFNFDRAFTDPLKKLYSNGHREPILLLVDGLDEALVPAGKALAEILAKLSDFPEKVRILATSRADRRVLKFFKRSKSIDLIKDTDPKVDDVKSYAEGRLACLETVTAPKRKEFAQ